MFQLIEKERVCAIDPGVDDVDGNGLAPHGEACEIVRTRVEDSWVLVGCRAPFQPGLSNVYAAQGEKERVAVKRGIEAAALLEAFPKERHAG